VEVARFRENGGELGIAMSEIDDGAAWASRRSKIAVWPWMFWAEVDAGDGRLAAGKLGRGWALRRRERCGFGLSRARPVCDRFEQSFGSWLIGAGLGVALIAVVVVLIG
jgi:hypothetical protein